MSKVLEPKSTEEFNHMKKSAGKKLIVVDFSAEWCGPCQNIKGGFHELSTKYPHVCFIELEEGRNKDIMQATYPPIKGFPTFHFYLPGKLVENFSGADIGRVEQLVETHGHKEDPNVFSGTGITLGGSGQTEAKSNTDNTSGMPVVDASAPVTTIAFRLHDGK